MHFSKTLLAAIAAALPEWSLFFVGEPRWLLWRRPAPRLAQGSPPNSGGDWPAVAPCPWAAQASRTDPAAPCRFPCAPARPADYKQVRSSRGLTRPSPLESRSFRARHPRGSPPASATPAPHPCPLSHHSSQLKKVAKAVASDAIPAADFWASLEEEKVRKLGTRPTATSGRVCARARTTETLPRLLRPPRPAAVQGQTLLSRQGGLGAAPA